MRRKVRVIITNGARGIEVHDLDGMLLKHLDEGYMTNSVTILHDFQLAGKPVDLVLATYPDDRVAGVKLWSINPEKAKLSETPRFRVLYDPRQSVSLRDCGVSQPSHRSIVCVCHYGGGLYRPD